MWGAVLASSLTVVVVFLPLLVLKLEVGQLFRDTAVAISAAILVSMVVSITVIPALAALMLRGPVEDIIAKRRLPIVDALAARFVEGTVRLARYLIRHRVAAMLVVIVLCGGTALMSWLLLPRLEYLPEGSRNAVNASVQLPPGYNLDTSLAIAESVETQLRPLW